MEPRSFERGKLPTHAPRAARQHASMEPRSFERGKVFTNFKHVLPMLASMEPRSFERGKLGRCLIDRERSMNWILCGGLGLGISFP